MGCSSGRPLPRHRRDTSMGNSESTGTDYDVDNENGENGSQVGNPRVHWGDDDDDDDEDDYLTDYNLDMSNYKLRAVSSKGPRSAATSAGRSGLTSAGFSSAGRSGLTSAGLTSAGRSELTSAAYSRATSAGYSALTSTGVSRATSAAQSGVTGTDFNETFSEDQSEAMTSGHNGYAAGGRRAAMSAGARSRLTSADFNETISEEQSESASPVLNGTVGGVHRPAVRNGPRSRLVSADLNGTISEEETEAGVKGFNRRHSLGQSEARSAVLDGTVGAEHRVPTSAGARSRLTTTSAGEMFEGSEYFDMETTMTEGQSEGQELELEKPGIHAPSLSLWYNDEEPGDILVQDVYVPKMGLTKHTYYCCLQWNAGMNGGGYCGIQDHSKGRNYIFSIWDPIDSNEKIKPVYVGPGTICEPFGGEGNGLKSWNFTLGWEPDSWYTVLTRRWDSGNHTCFGFWVKHQMTLEWTHVVTVDFPVAETYFETLSCSFLEDWEGSGHSLRRVHFKNGYKHGLNGKWLPFNKAVFSNVVEMRSKVYEDSFDAGVLDDTFYLQSGGDSIQTKDAVNGNMITRQMPHKPDVLPVCVYLSSVTPEQMSWEIPTGSVPQFQYIVYVDRLIYKQEINSEIRTCIFKTPPKEIVELLIEDIYGHAVRSKFKVDNPPDCDPETRTRLEVYIPTASH